MKNKIILFGLAIMTLFLVGCGAKTEEKQEEIIINIGVPKAPPTLPLLRMIETSAMGDGVTINLDYWNSPEQLIAMTQDGKHDLFALPLTVGAKLFNKDVPIQLTNVNTWGVTYFITTNPSVTQWSDLKGETIYVPLKSSPPDIVTQFLLESNGLTIGEDIEIKYAGTAEIGQLITSGQIENAVVIEPQATGVLMGNKAARTLYSYDQEWKKIMGQDKDIPNAGMGATLDFINNSPDIMKRFEQEYEKALEWTLENPDKIAVLAEEELGIKKEIIEKAIPTAGIMYKSGKDAQEDLKLFYEVLYAFDPTTIGGSIPSGAFYYGAE